MALVPWRVPAWGGANKQNNQLKLMKKIILSGFVLVALLSLVGCSTPTTTTSTTTTNTPATPATSTTTTETHTQ